MLVVMQEGATEHETQAVIDRIVSLGFIVHRSTGVVHTVLGGVARWSDVDRPSIRGDGRRQRIPSHCFAL